MSPTIATAVLRPLAVAPARSAPPLLFGAVYEERGLVGALLPLLPLLHSPATPAATSSRRAPPLLVLAAGAVVERRPSLPTGGWLTPPRGGRDASEVSPLGASESDARLLAPLEAALLLDFSSETMTRRHAAACWWV